MWVSGRKKWFFNSYDPRAKKRGTKYVVVNQDEVTVEKLSTRIPLFIEEMNEKLEYMGFKWGDQWT